MSFKTLVLLAALAASSRALPTENRDSDYSGPLVGRTNGCDADNALRNLRDKRYSSAASIFCSEWLQSTITNTLLVTATASATATETPQPVTVTVPETVTVTNTETSYTTEYPTAVNTFVKRGEIPYPTWLSASYPATRVSSACSCFIPTPSPAATTTLTTTVATQTNTATTTLEPLTDTATSFITATASATTIITETGPEVPCGVTGCGDGTGFFDQSSQSSAAGCLAYCEADSSCKSFQWGVGICNIFDVEVAGTYAIGTSTDPTCSDFKFYDVKCVL
ncbi:hypothetical protein TWF281_001364 [Arthrobotrys megalospora]